jgi:hypothetical protein
MFSQEAPPPSPSVRLLSSRRAPNQQLALPLPAAGSPGPAPPALVLLGEAARVRPRQVWVRLPAPIQAEVRRAVWQVLEEVIRDERHG